MEGGPMSSVKKVTKPLEFEVFVKVYCPHCAASEKGKEIGIMLPARGLPDSIQCFNCSKAINTKDVLTKGKEKMQLASNDEKIKGVLK